MRKYITNNELRTLTTQVWNKGYPVDLVPQDMEFLNYWAKQRIDANAKSNVDAGRQWDLQNLTKRQTVGLIGEYCFTKYLKQQGYTFEWTPEYNQNNTDLVLHSLDKTQSKDVGVKTLIYDPNGYYVNTFQIRTAESVNRPHICQSFVMIKAAQDTVWSPIPMVQVRFCGSVMPDILYKKDENNDYYYLDMERKAPQAMYKAGFTGLELLIQRLQR